MNDDRKYITVIVLLLIAIAALLWKDYKKTEVLLGDAEPVNVSQLLEVYPLNQFVHVKGNVTFVLDDYESQKGNVYQRFYLSDSEKEILAFCLVKDSERLNVSDGEKIVLRGKFVEYGDFVEITHCEQS